MCSSDRISAAPIPMMMSTTVISAASTVNETILVASPT
jgi:hypothetical protein